MTCETCQLTLARGRLSPDAGINGGAGPDADVAEHLAECPSCRAAQAAFAAIDRSLQPLPTWTPSANFAQRVVAAASREWESTTLRVAGITPEAMQLATSLVVAGLGVAAVGGLARAVILPALARAASSPEWATVWLCATSVVWSIWMRRRLARN